MKHIQCSWKKIAVVSFLAGLLTVNTALGSGFAIYETSARGLAIGNADSARAADASTLYTNPAAMTSLEGTQISFGATAIMPDMRVTTTSGNSSLGINEGTITPLNNYTAVAPNLYVTQKLGTNFSVGLGVFVPYGLKSTFPDHWFGAANNYYTEIQTVNINPNIAWKIFQKGEQSLSIAAGVQVVYLKAEISKAVTMNPAIPSGAARNLVLEGDNIDYGWNLALQWEINKQLAIGITYRSEVKQELDDATAKLPSSPSVMGPLAGAKVDASGKITLPQSASIGITYTPTEKWLFAIQALWTGWSSFDSLDIYIEGLGVTPSTKNWNDTWRYSIGAEYHYNEFISLRAGFVWDCDPVPASTADFLVPSNDRRIYSAGIGLNFTPNFSVDFAYALIFIDSRNISERPQDHIYTDARVDKGHANIVSLSCNWKF